VPDLSIIVPIYNERATVATAVDQLLAAELPVLSYEVVLVDDGSTDGTREWLRDQAFPSSVQLVLHDRNRGKGAAVRTGLQHASGTYATILDADLEYAPESLTPLLRPLLEGDAQVVYGVRGFEAHSAFSFSDIMTCHKVLPTSLFRALHLRERGFAFEAEITARLAGSGVRIYEVPVTYRARSREDGKKLTAADGLRVLRTLLRCRVDRRVLREAQAHIPPPPELTDDLRARFERVRPVARR
jgi:dolichol-phosphate hexosyltransferase